MKTKLCKNVVPLKISMILIREVIHLMGIEIIVNNV